MSNQVIPEAAVKAAAKAAYIFHSSAPGFDAELAWDDMAGGEDWERGQWELEARAALEAAAPHMLPEAWDEGYTTGNAHNGRRDANPYRETKFDPHTAKPNNWV